MTNETRSPAEIESEIERERAGLSETLDELQDRFSFEGMTRQVTDQFREHSGEIGRSLSEAVKRNPTALALTGIGIAWMIFGNNRASSYKNTDRIYSSRRQEHLYDDYDVADSRTNLERPVPYDNPASRYPDNRLGSRPNAAARPYYSGTSSPTADVPSWARTVDEDYDYGDDSPSMKDRVGSAASSARDNVSGAVSSVGATAGSAGSKVSDGAHAVSDAARHAGSSAADRASRAGSSIRSAGQSAMRAGRDAGHSVAERAAIMRERLAEGTEHLGEEARARVIAARERAVRARDSAMYYGRQGRDRAADMFEEQPLIAGAIAVAIGAAIGAAIPRSRMEDQYMGAYSDDLMHEAERIFAQETEKLGKVATAAKDEALKVAREAQDDAESTMDAAVDKAKASGQRVADAAKDEADKQKVGDISS